MMLYRIALPVIVIFLYGGILLVRALGLQRVYDNILYDLGIIPFDWPFVDAYAILLAAQCHREGINVSIPNPCNVIFSYSPLWLDLVPPFLTTEYTPVIGGVFNLTFVGALYAVLRPASWREFTCLAVACTSTSVTFAVERGNVDLFIFALAALAVILYGRGRTARLAAYATCFFAGLLKFYPFVLLTISLREPPKQLMRIAGAAIIAFVAFIVYYRDALIYALHVIPTGGYFAESFSAKNLPFGIVEFLSGTGYEPALTYSIFLAAIAEYVLLTVVFVRSFDTQKITIDWTIHEARCLLVGSLLIVGCFFAVQNAGYRGIHMLFVLSGLITLRRSTGDRVLRYLLLFTIGAVLLVMWGEGIRHSFEFLLILIGLPDKMPGIPSTIFWVMRELTWWWIISVLTAMVALFVIQSPSARDLARIWTSRRPSSG